MQLVSKEEQARLGEAYRRRSLVESRYGRDGRNENTRYILQHFFKVSGDITARAANYEGKGSLTEAQIALLLNTPSGLFYAIADKFANYVGTPKVDGQPVSIKQAVADFVATGYAVLALEKASDGKYRIVCVPASGTTVEGGSLRSIELYRHDGKTYAYARTYLKGKTLHELYRLTQASSLQEADAVPLATLPFLASVRPEEETGLSEPAAMLVNGGVEPYGESPLFAICEPIVQSVERKSVMFETQFLQNVESYVLFKNINIPVDLMKPNPNGGSPRVNVSQLGRLIMGNEDAGVEFVNNTNPLIRDALEFTTSQLYLLSALTSIPEEFLGIEVRDGAIGQGSRNLKHGAFVKKIESLRACFEEAFARLAAMRPGETGTTSWDDVFAKTDTELVDELSKARDAGLLSRKRAITLYLGGNEKMAEDEMLEIRREADGETAMSESRT